MYFDLSKPQKLLQQSVRDFCRREVPITRVRELMETDSATDAALWADMADQGWVGLHLAEEFEGLGLGPVELAIVAEELGRACAPGPWLPANWAATLLAASRSPIAAEVLPAIVGGSVCATVAFLDEQGSWESAVEAIQTTLSDDGSVLNGRKDLVMEAEDCGYVLCVARCRDELCLVIVPTDGDGLRITVTPGIDATRKVYRCDFDDVSIGPKRILAQGRAAVQALEASQEVMTVAVCAEMLGILEWLLESTVEYSKTRKQFDRVIGSFQVVQHMCADILALKEGARSAVWYAAWALQEKKADASRSVAVAKVYVSDAVRQAGNLAVQVHGGIGFTWEHDLHLYYKRAKASEFLFGDATFHRERLAEFVFSS